MMRSISPFGRRQHDPTFFNAKSSLRLFYTVFIVLAFASASGLSPLFTNGMLLLEPLRVSLRKNLFLCKFRFFSPAGVFSGLPATGFQAPGTVTLSKVLVLFTSFLL